MRPERLREIEHLHATETAPPWAGELLAEVRRLHDVLDVRASELAEARWLLDLVRQAGVHVWTDGSSAGVELPTTETCRPDETTEG